MCTVCGCATLSAPSDAIHFHDHADAHDARHDHGSGTIHFGKGPAGVAVAGLSQERTIRIERDILAKNASYAAANRTRLSAAGVFARNFVSSPGSGKTSLLVRTINDLKASSPIAVIEGDQQTSRDAERIRATGAPAVQINTGKGCHLDAHMVGHALDQLPLAPGGLLFIENVGNLVCSAAFDLGEAHKVVVLSVTAGEDKPLKYPDMFAAADLMLLNKSDLLPHLDFDMEACLAAAVRVNPAIQILIVSARTGEGLDSTAGSRRVRRRCRTWRSCAHLDAEPVEAREARSHGRLRVRVTGAVQGVGFRPFMHGLTLRCGVSGFVLNDDAGVLAEIEGGDLGTFLTALRRDGPPLARIDAVEVTPLPRQRRPGFAIRPSVGTGGGRTRLGPDTAPCHACLGDLFDCTSRFHHYPFVTCTECGPRFTIAHRLPYDRANTSMAGFALCAADYGNAADRRFHAETIACPTCGTRLSHSISDMADALGRGQIVALKGIGGLHLLCDATNGAAVEALRRRKRRPAKPLAVMVANADSARLFGDPTEAEIALLRDRARPIVLVRSRAGLAASVAPGLVRVGIMLPSAPVHHLLFHALARFPVDAAWRAAPQPFALVATSANAVGEPLAITDAGARRSLTGIADLIVTHDRPILARADDSVMAIIGGAPAYVRRARGTVPAPVDLGRDGPPKLALGAHLKATLCITRGREAFVSQHVGDLSTAATVRFYEETERAMLALLNVAPDVVACDLHPDYRSSVFAETLGLPVLRVQHHAAHVAAVAAEHGLRGAIIGVALDGSGQGDDGAAWGGELILLDGPNWHREGHLRPLGMPGGDGAAREPWRLGVAALAALGRAADAAARFGGIAGVGRLAAFLAANPRCPATSSMGRLFDAAAALLGVCLYQSYEGAGCDGAGGAGARA
jgi:hydrogenase maturation protein HypF